MTEQKRPLGLQVQNLSVWMKKRCIVENVSFSLCPGITAILGENGAGKTTLLRGMLSLADRQTGQVRLTVETREEREIPEEGNTQNMRELRNVQNAQNARNALQESLALSQMSHRERARYLAYVPQELQSGIHASVLEFAVMGRTPYMHLLDTPKRSDYELAYEALGELGISHLADRMLDQLSGGERRIAYLARARVQGACFMLLDEPLAGLDYGRQHHFFQVLQEYGKRTGTGTLLTIHDPVMAWTYAEQVLVMSQGKLKQALNKTDPDFEEKYLEQMEQLYGMQAGFADTELGRTLVWREQKKC